MDPDAIAGQLDDGAQIVALMRRFYPLLLAAAYQDAGDLLGGAVAFDLENERVQEVLGALAGLVVGVAETTRDDIRALVGRAAQEGWDTATLAQAIREAGVTQSRARATLIARTEAASAYSQGALLAYRESGVVTGVEWLTAGDPCPVCDPLDGQVVGLGKAFDGGIAHPPAHPGCRCAIAPVV